MPINTESVLLVPVLGLPDVIEQWRRRLDPVGSQGIPAHVTVLYPFVAPGKLADHDLDEIRRAFIGVKPFNFFLTGLAHFGDSVLYATPEPSEAFIELTNRVVRSFPEHLPYGGVYPVVTPHLTISQCPGHDADRAATDIEPLLPWRGRVTEAWLMVGRDENHRWSDIARFPFGH
jgi:2'-5' RNA ligase